MKGGYHNPLDFGRKKLTKSAACWGKELTQPAGFGRGNYHNPLGWREGATTIRWVGEKRKAGKMREKREKGEGWS